MINNSRATIAEFNINDIEKKPSKLQWLIMFIFPVCLFIISLFLGRYQVPPEQVFHILGQKLFHLPIDTYWNETVETVVIKVRLPRAIMAALIGAGLSASGASFQGMFQNPLVSPFILGVSAGASFGAAIGLVFELPSLGIQGLAFLFGLIAVFITYIMAHIYKVTPILMLVLSGMVVSAFFQAMLSLIKFIADGDEKLPAITFWLMGSLGSVGLKDLGIAAIPICISMVGLFLVRWRLNVLSMGDRESRALGINNERIKLFIIICTTIITSTAVAFCGIIGWVGQVIPHFCRMIVGPDHKVLIPATMLVGAGYLIMIDNLCRLLSATEIPLGILTAVIGAPVFAYLLRKTKGGWN
ncbi:MAG: FecCD family ABC transporter permease [Peptococcales bacterium]|jgi:iron complex transport system permease protein